MTDEVFRDIVDLHVLPIKTRLEDDGWLHSPMQNICIDGVAQYNLLSRALDLAKQCIWFFLERHKPRQCRDLYPGGWGEVKLGRDELHRKFGQDCSHERIREALGFRQNSPNKIYALLFDLVHLRNKVSHFDVIKAGEIDGHLKTVQKLTIHFYDEPRAWEARGLRDQLRVMAEDTVNEIAGLEPLILLPFAGYPWQGHHEEMFQLVRLGSRMELPETVKRMGSAWDDQLSPYHIDSVQNKPWP